MDRLTHGLGKLFLKIVGNALLSRVAPGSFALVSATDHDSRALTGEFKAFLAKKAVNARRHVEFPSGARTDALAVQIAGLGVKAVVVLAGARDSAGLVKALRREQGDLLIFGGPSMGRRSLLRHSPLRFPRSQFLLKARSKTTHYCLPGTPQGFSTRAACKGTSM